MPRPPDETSAPRCPYRAAARRWLHRRPRFPPAEPLVADLLVLLAQAAAGQVASEPVQAADRLAWWSEFQDPELTSLEQRSPPPTSIFAPPSFRLAESRAQRSVAPSDQFPRSTATPPTRARRRAIAACSAPSGAARARPARAGPGRGTWRAAPAARAEPVASSPARSIPPFNLFQYGFDASWELDFWGRVRRESRIRRRQRGGLGRGRGATRCSRSLAEVARDYIAAARRAAQFADHAAEHRDRAAEPTL